MPKSRNRRSCKSGQRPRALEAAFAGVAPLQASGNTRAVTGSIEAATASSTGHTIALTRFGHDPRTRTYRDRRAAEGATRREIIRILKRRELF